MFMCDLSSLWGYVLIKLSAKLENLVALALGVGLEEAEVALPEPAAGSEAGVGIVVWDKLVAEAASCLGMGCR